MLTKEQDNDSNKLKDPETSAEYEIIDKILLMEWLAEHYKQYGAPARSSAVAPALAAREVPPAA